MVFCEGSFNRGTTVLLLLLLLLIIVIIILNLSPSLSFYKLPALRTLGNIVTGTDDQTQAVLDGGILPFLHSLVINTRPTIIRVKKARPQ